MLDQRDWTSYVYVALLIIAILIPIRIYDLYRESMIQATVIESIASGDPDIRRILGIVNIDPTADFEGIPVSERKEASTYDYKNMEVLSHNRIIDLRHWDPSASTDERRGRIYVSDRLTVRFNEDYEGDKVFILRVPVFTKNIEFRQRDTQVTGTISRIAEPMEYFGEMRTLFEVQYDLSSLGPAESVDLHLEMAAPLEVETRTARFTTELKTDLVSVWMLFPSDRPYRTYNLVQYPANKSEAPEIVDARYSIDHPYGSLIGWSVVNPEMESVYECRWTHD